MADIFLAARYRVVDLIAQGTSGSILRVYDTQEGSYAAAKVLLGDEVSEQRRGDFGREIDVLKRLDHPGVVRLLSHDARHTPPFYLMPLFTGGSLAKAGASFDTSLLWRIAADSVEALAYMQDAGIAHGDVKPNNIVLDGNGRPVLVDFGCARDLHADNEARPLAGAPDFLAPERIVDKSPPTSAADIFALGVTLYYLASGVLPFEAPTPAQTLRRVLAGARRPLGALRDDLSEALVHWIDSCLHGDAARRPDAPTLLASCPEALDAAAERRRLLSLIASPGVASKATAG